MPRDAVSRTANEKLVTIVAKYGELHFESCYIKQNFNFLHQIQSSSIQPLKLYTLKPNMLLRKCKLEFRFKAILYLRNRIYGLSVQPADLPD